MRYYLFTVQHNKITDSENRTIPKAFDNRQDAIAEFHTQMGKDMKNGTLDWALSVVINDAGGIEADEKWSEYIAPNNTPTGSRYDPITFESEMMVEKGLWYKDIETDITGLCIKDGIANFEFDEEFFVFDEN